MRKKALPGILRGTRNGGAVNLKKQQSGILEDESFIKSIRERFIYSDQELKVEI